MTIGSLFSGIGGLEHGLELAGLGETIWQVEINPFSRCVLAAHWPHAERFEDVCKVGQSNLAPVDLICGGFPCEDTSSAGKGAGLSGDRSGLWFEFRRVVAELRPSWVVVENVAGGASRWVDAVRESLEELDYVSLPIPLSAADCGAWHERARVFIVAHARGDSRRAQPGRSRGARGTDPAELGHTREERGSATDAHGLRELQPERREQEQRRWPANGAVADHDGERDAARQSAGVPTREPHVDGRTAGKASAYDDGERGGQRQGHAREERTGGGESSRGATSDAVCEGREGPGPSAHAGWRRLAQHAGWAPQPGLVPLVSGLSGGMVGRRRRARLRALGKVVVPHQAEVIGHIIRELAEAEMSQ